MAYIKTVPLKSGFFMPVLGMGTWGFGGRTERNPGNDDKAQIALLREGIETGFSLIDTAEYYAGGYAENLVGEAIRGFDREKLFLTSKVWKTHLSPADLIRAAENSLARLKTDYLDLYLYHQYSPEIPLAETIEAMNLLIDRGLVRSIGVSNFGAARLQQAMACSRHPITVDQVHYNLGVRDAEPELLDFCRRNNVILQAWRPVRDLEPESCCRTLMAKYQITFQQLALAWLLNQPGVTTLAATGNTAHLKKNCEAANLSLTTGEIELLREKFPRRSRGADVKLA